MFHEAPQRSKDIKGAISFLHVTSTQMLKHYFKVIVVLWYVAACSDFGQTTSNEDTRVTEKRHFM